MNRLVPNKISVYKHTKAPFKARKVDDF